jgi:hypothetical protein
MSSHPLNNPTRYAPEEDEWQKLLDKYGEKDHFKKDKNKINIPKEDEDDEK